MTPRRKRRQHRHDRNARIQLLRRQRSQERETVLDPPDVTDSLPHVTPSGRGQHSCTLQNYMADPACSACRELEGGY